MNIETTQLDRGFSSRSDIERAMQERGAHIVLVKLLAPNNDNSKNQIVLGTGHALNQFFPGETRLRGVSASTGKPNSHPGEPIVETKLKFEWLYPDGAFPAPGTTVIDYNQYPETRLSGFLRGCERGPRSLVKEEQHLYGRRVLLLGVADEIVYGAIITDNDNKHLVDELEQLPRSAIQGMLRELRLPGSGVTTDLDKLRDEIEALTGTPQPSRTLNARDPRPQPIPATGQAGGWTLEAGLEVVRNGTPGADKYGYEVKAVGSGKVSVITTEPDLGYRAENGFRTFMAEYGSDGARPGYRQFVGIHKCGEYQPSTGCTLTMDHWNLDTNNPSGTGDPAIFLVSESTGVKVAGWSFTNIAANWMKKHQGSFYVESSTWLMPGEEEPTHYLFGPRVLVAVGTSPVNFFRAVADGIIVLDPGDRIAPNGEAKPRTQWRVPGAMRTRRDPWYPTQLPARLSKLYDYLEVRDSGVVVARFQQGALIA